jgi:hypothetical protein
MRAWRLPNYGCSNSSYGEPGRAQNGGAQAGCRTAGVTSCAFGGVDAVSRVMAAQRYVSISILLYSLSGAAEGGSRLLSQMSTLV